MTTYAVIAAEQTKSGLGAKGDGSVYKLGLSDGEKTHIAELYVPGGMRPPSQDSTIEAEIVAPDNPNWLPKVQLARAGGSRGGGRSYEADPKKQAAIAMEASQKVAADIVGLALQHLDYKPGSVGELTQNVKQVAAALYGQIEEVSK